MNAELTNKTQKQERQTWVDGAHRGILDREASVKSANNYNFAFNLINELLDYGIDLLPKAYDNSPHDTKALCLICVQFRQTLAHLDAIAILASMGNCYSASLQCRGILEISLTMEWLLKRDTESKVNHLYVANLRRRRQWQSIPIPGTPEAKLHADEAQRVTVSSSMLKQIQAEVNAIDKVLAKPEYAPVNAKFESGYAKNNYDKQWYEVYGTQSIRKMAEQIGRAKEYRIFYSSLSEASHGGNIYKNVTFEPIGSIHPIREPEKVPALAHFAFSRALAIYRMILEQYLPNDISVFQNKYMREWRIRFLHSIPK